MQTPPTTQPAHPTVTAVASRQMSLPGVVVVLPGRFGDERGYFAETYHAGKWHAAGIDVDFVQDNESLSGPVGTVRGLHYQLPPFAQAKLVRVVRGSILDVAVDIRRSSPTFGHHAAEVLTAAGGEQLYVPTGFAHGFATLEPDTIVAYKVSAVYAPQAERGIRFDDPALGIDWRVPAAAATLSGRDRAHPTLAAQGDVFA